jgi:hypothetical protein
LPILQVNGSKVTIDLNDFPSLLESMTQQPLIQLSQLSTRFHYNENFDYALINILKNNWDSLLENSFIVQHFL